MADYLVSCDTVTVNVSRVLQLFAMPRVDGIAAMHVARKCPGLNRSSRSAVANCCVIQTHLWVSLGLQGQVRMLTPSSVGNTMIWIYGPCGLRPVPVYVCLCLMSSHRAKARLYCHYLKVAFDVMENQTAPLEQAHPTMSVRFNQQIRERMVI